MKKRDLARAVYRLPWDHYRRASSALEKFEARTSGQRGAEEARDRFWAALERLYVHPAPPAHLDHEARLARWKARSAIALAAAAGEHYDEHGYRRGDYLSTRGLDYVPPHLSATAPFCDLGGAGLGLIEIVRTRIYPSSSQWRPSSVSTSYMVGRNEAGTYFSHPVPAGCKTVLEAVQWIWSGMASRILQRQGDVALIWGSGPKLPALPRGHRIEGDQIVHATHPALPLPGKGQRVIVGRRAAERASAATRD